MLECDAAAQATTEVQENVVRSRDAERERARGRKEEQKTSVIDAKTIDVKRGTGARSIMDRAAMQTIRVQLESEGGGRPASAIPLAPASEFQSDLGQSRARLPQPAWRHWHPSQRFAETVDKVGQLPDVVAMLSPDTSHVPVMWFHGDQIQRARAAGAVIPIAEGPSQFGGLRSVPMADTYVDRRTWLAQCAWYQAMSIEYSRLERGYKFRYSRIPGGRDGLYTPPEATKPEWRRVAVQNVDGWARPRFPQLPDEFTEMRVEALYQEGVKEGASDLGILSEVGLYGVQSHCTASSASPHGGGLA